MKRSTAENVNATAVELTAADLRALDDGFPAGVAAGDRHAPEAMRAVEA
jgi:hypothetical protein